MELLVFVLIIIILLQSMKILSEFKQLKRENALLRDLLAEQSEMIRKIKVKTVGVEQVKDLPPGTELDEIRIKDKKQ